MGNTINFSDAAGTTVSFSFSEDQIIFDGVFSAGEMTLTQLGPDVAVTCNGTTVTLAAVTIEELLDANFAFADGSVVRFDTSNQLTGSDQADYFYFRNSGTETVTAGGGDDTIVVGDHLDPTDAIDGGAGNDTVIVSGSLSVTLSPTTITEVEDIVYQGGGTFNLTLSNEAVSSALAGTLAVDGSAEGQNDQLIVDGSSVSSGSLHLIGGDGSDTFTGGAGGDTLVGGDGSDTISGGGGADIIEGGLGADTLTGGGGNDVYRFGFGIPRSESAPSTVDTITDFEGLGVAGGDQIDLPSFYGNLPLAFNSEQLQFSYTPGVPSGSFMSPDGFADISWHWTTIGSWSGIEIWVDADDDGQFGEQDMLIHLTTSDPNAKLVAADFSDSLIVYRGTDQSDSYEGTSLGNIAFGQGGDDVLDGNDGNDQLHGGDGVDTLNGGLGDDQLFGDDESDTLNGGLNNDTLDGGSGDDTLNGDEGTDTLVGGLGADTLHGGENDDTLMGGVDAFGNGDTAINKLFGDAGNDTLYGDGGADELHGGDGADTLSGNGGTDQLFGDGENDTLLGASGDDILQGGAGTDTLDGGIGADTLTGGTEADVFRFFSASDSNLAGIDVVTDFNQLEGDKLDLSVERGGPGSYDGGQLVFMGQLEATFTGTLGDQFIRTDGLKASDIGAGFSQVWWKVIGGHAYLYADINSNFELDGKDLVVQLDGSAPIQLTAGDFLAGNFKVIVGTPGDDTPLTLPATDGDDIVYTVGGNDTVDGLAGSDTIYGGDGMDTLNGGLDGDQLYGEGNDDTLNGDEGSDTLVGGFGADTLHGGDNADILIGGVDAFGNGDTAINKLFGDAGNDTLYGDNGHDELHGGDDDDVLVGNDGADQLYGDKNNDTLLGGTGDDILQGGADTDTLDGGAGADTLTGGTEADVFRILTASASTFAEHDTITDFNQSDGDKLDLSVARGSPGNYDGGPLVFMGQLGAAFTGTLGDQFIGVVTPYGVLQGSDIGPGFSQIWWKELNGHTYLYGDTNGNFELDGTDLVVQLDGTSPIQLTKDDFVAGNFKVIVGTPGDDTPLTLPATDGDDIVYTVGGNDT
ncbi:calcium-binding protein, partial [Mesorhizobium sp. VK24D]